MSIKSLTILASSMSFQLALRSIGSLHDIKTKWFKYNHDSGHQVQVSQNIEKPKARYFSICFSAPKTGWKDADGCCKAHIKAVGTSRDVMTVISLDCVHTCGGDSIRRKRNYLTRDLMEVSDALALYQPTTTKEGNTKQYQTMAISSTGVAMKKGQAHLAVRSKSSSTIDAQIGQYMWIPSLLTLYYQMDPGGSYVCSYKDCPWDDDLHNSRESTLLFPLLNTSGAMVEGCRY